MSLSQRLFLFRVIHATLLDFKPTSLLNDHVLRPPSCVTKACHLQAACAALKSAPKRTHPSNFNMADRHSKGDRNTSFQVAEVCSEPCSMRMTDKLGVICMVEGDIQIPTACSWFRKHSHQWFTRSRPTFRSSFTSSQLQTYYVLKQRDRLTTRQRVWKAEGIYHPAANAFEQLPLKTFFSPLSLLQPTTRVSTRSCQV